MYRLIYHPIVRKRIISLFAAINRGDPQPVYDSFAKQFEHYFLGVHTFGGSRHSLPKVKAWYERLFRLLPDIHFDIADIIIAGPPWNTIAQIRWREYNSGVDGVRAEAEGTHVVRLAWGQMTFLGIYPDTVALVSTLQRMAAKGIAEAAAPPIED